MALRTVIVTGATGALGRAAVAVFQNHGDQVVPVSRSSDEWRFDLSELGAADRLVQAVVDRYGRLDAVVHTVGGYAQGGTDGGQVWDTWSRMIEMNLRPATLMLAASIPLLRRVADGRFVAVGSRAGTVATPGAAAYAATKAALHSLMITAAEELKGSGVTVNAVLPSTLDTPANREWGQPEQFAKWVQPTSVAEAIFWLVSDLASDVSGCLLPVYGAAD